MKFFTSDLHLGHKRIIDYCDRPFSSSDEMTETLVQNFKSVVRPGDELYILGDLSFNAGQAVNFLRQISGQKFMVWGNHDPRSARDREPIQKLLVKSGDILETKLSDGIVAVMCHYPMLRWNKGHFGSYMLHGHTHGGCSYPYPMRILDVGVDSTVELPYPARPGHPKYFPWSEKELSAYMADIPQLQHHDREE